MFFNDYLLFAYQMIRSEFERVKRLFLIIILGSFLVFFITFMSTVIKTQISKQYSGRYVLLPYKVNTNNIESTLLTSLIDQNIFKEIESMYGNTVFIQNEVVNQAELTNINKNDSALLNIEENIDSNEILINLETLEINGWKIDDIYRLNATIIEFQGVHNRDGLDILLPKSYLQSSKDNTIDNFITIKTDKDIQEITQYLNDNISDVNYEYRVDDISANDIFVSIISTIENILLIFSFIIFIVSSSNIGTIMPYFINEFKDEIILLRLHGLSQKYIYRIFILTTFLILSISLLISVALAYSFTTLISIITGVVTKHSILRIILLLLFQCISGCLFSYNGIKKASYEVAYL